MINRGQWGYGADFFVKMCGIFGGILGGKLCHSVCFCVKLRELQREKGEV